MRRLTILLVTVAAFMFAAAAPAFAGTGTIKVNLAGSGQGEVTGNGGLFSGTYEGNPPIECSNVTGEELTVCETHAWGNESMYVRAQAAEGFEFAGYTIVKGEMGEPEFPTCSTGGPPTETEEFIEAADFEGSGRTGRPCLIKPHEEGGEAEVIVTFVKERKTLTVAKIGLGTIESSPAGINCGSFCSAKFEEKAKVTLTANPESGYVFKRWIGCTKTTEGTGSKGHTCTVEMTKSMEVKAEFAAVNALTLNKGGTGSGTVTSAPGGISCTPSCTNNVAVFETTKTVLLKASPLTSTSEFEAWEGCESEPEGKCSVAMSKAQSVVAKFKPIPQFVLTFSKAGGGTGTVASSPAGISCGTTCSSGEASFLKGKVVSLKQTAASGSSFGGWSGCESESEGKCIVAMTKAQSVTATFK